MNGEVTVVMTIRVTRVVKANGGIEKLATAADKEMKKFLDKLNCDHVEVIKEKRFYNEPVHE